MEEENPPDCVDSPASLVSEVAEEISAPATPSRTQMSFTGLDGSRNFMTPDTSVNVTFYTAMPIEEESVLPAKVTPCSYPDSSPLTVCPHPGRSGGEKTAWEERDRYTSPVPFSRRQHRNVDDDAVVWGIRSPKSYTPEGLRPRRSIEEIRAKLGLRLLDVNSHTKARPRSPQVSSTSNTQSSELAVSPGPIDINYCSNEMPTAKKTNVSFSSSRSQSLVHHTSIQRSVILEFDEENTDSSGSYGRRSRSSGNSKSIDR